MTLLFCNHLGIGQIAASRRAFEGLPEVPDDSDDAIWARDLHLQVGLMCIEHELGECGQTQKSMVRTAEVGDLKQIGSLLKFSSVPKMTSSRMRPNGVL